MDSMSMESSLDIKFELQFRTVSLIYHLLVCKYNNVNIYFKNIGEMTIYMKFFRMFRNSLECFLIISITFYIFFQYSLVRKTPY